MGPQVLHCHEKATVNFYCQECKKDFGGMDGHHTKRRLLKFLPISKRTITSWVVNALEVTNLVLIFFLLQ